MTTSDTAAQCRMLKNKILAAEDLNRQAALNVTRTRASISRLRLEYSILLEHLEKRSGVPLPPLAPEYELTDKKNTKKKKPSTPANSHANDPLHPKKPINAYLHYMEDRRAHNESPQVISDSWRNLSPEDKEVYQQKFNADKERYQLEMVVYNKRLKDAEGHAVPVATEEDDAEEDLPHKPTTNGNQ